MPDPLRQSAVYRALEVALRELERSPETPHYWRIREQLRAALASLETAEVVMRLVSGELVHTEPHHDTNWPTFALLPLDPPTSSTAPS